MTKKTVELADIDLSVLREIQEPGSQTNLSWGAAMSVSLEWLKGHGLVSYLNGVVELTKEGTKVVNAYNETEDDPTRGSEEQP